MTLSLPKAIFLGALVLGVIAFDIWFFFGPESDEPNAPPASVDTENPASATADEHTTETQNRHPLEEQRTSSPAAPWHDPVHWRTNTRKPLRGSLRANLMNPAPDDKTNAYHQAFATAVPVILWHRDRPLAIIGEEIYREGDPFGDYRVRKIEKDRVVLASRRDRDETVLWLAAMGDEEKETGKRAASHSEIHMSPRPRPESASIQTRSKETP